MEYDIDPEKNSVLQDRSTFAPQEKDFFMRPEPLTNVNNARRSLGQEVRMLEGFVGIGIGGKDTIRLYVKDRKIPVVRYVESNYGDHYAGYLLEGCA